MYTTFSLSIYLLKDTEVVSVSSASCVVPSAVMNTGVLVSF